MIRIIRGDCLDVLRTLPAESVHAIVTDPPYGLAFMGKRWDYDVPAVEVWAECLRVLKPGGHLLAFAGTRTHHRMAVRIEDAGFEIRDMIAWVYGSGFPKSLDVSKAIDKAAGAEREVVGTKLGLPGYHLNPHEGGEALGRGLSSSTYETRLKSSQVTAPATDAARQWQGWGTALKPALEPITVARKPLIGTVAENVLAHGTGALNIDGCRVGDTVETWPATRSYAPGQIQPGGKGETQATGAAPPGRWPANLIHDGSDEVVALFPEVESGQPAGIKAGGKGNAYGLFSGGIPVTGYGDRGSAARFFYCAKADAGEREMGMELQQKFGGGQCTGRKEGSAGLNSPRAGAGRGGGRSNTHPTVKPVDLMRYLIRLVTPKGGTVLDPFAGSGTTGLAALAEQVDAILIERESQYVDIAAARVRGTAGLFADAELSVENN